MSNLIDDKDVVERILDKLDTIANEIVQLKLVSLKQENNIKEHMKRSDSLEKYLDIIKKDIEPIQKHVVYIDAFIKGLGLFSIIVGVIVGLLKIKQILL